jgi:copper chaperone CopZ
VAVVSETIQVSGIRCERCVARLAGVLRDHDGLESATANLVGDVSLSWDDRLTTREVILEALARGGFREAAPVGE